MSENDTLNQIFSANTAQVLRRFGCHIVLQCECGYLPHTLFFDGHGSRKDGTSAVFIQILKPSVLQTFRSRLWASLKALCGADFPADAFDTSCSVLASDCDDFYNFLDQFAEGTDVTTDFVELNEDNNEDVALRFEHRIVQLSEQTLLSEFTANLVLKKAKNWHQKLRQAYLYVFANNRMKIMSFEPTGCQIKTLKGLALKHNKYLDQEQEDDGS